MKISEKNKVMQYFSAAINVNFENITYDNLQVTSSHSIEDTLYQPGTDDEFE